MEGGSTDRTGGIGSSGGGGDSEGGERSPFIASGALGGDEISGGGGGGGFLQHDRDLHYCCHGDDADGLSHWASGVGGAGAVVGVRRGSELGGESFFSGGGFPSAGFQPL